MYVDGLVLLVIYTMAASALILSVYNYINNKELSERVFKKSKEIKRPLPPAVVKRPRGYWDKGDN